VWHVDSGMRIAYNESGAPAFDFTDLITREPFGNFGHWFDEARRTKSIVEPNAMFLATATKWVTLLVLISYSGNQVSYILFCC